MKKQNAQQNTPRIVCCSRRHKVWGIIALVGLFVCGLMIGFTMARTPSTAIEFQDADCKRLARTIDEQKSLLISYADNVERMKEIHSRVIEAQKLFAEGCSHYVPEATVAANDNPTNPIKPACAVVEETLLRYIGSESSPEPRDYVSNATVYLQLMENGCPENQERYKQLAARSLEIATSLQNEWQYEEDIENRGGETTTDIIEAYKKLDMKREAQEFLNKVQKLTDPAIDFIMKMQEVINE